MTIVDIAKESGYSVTTVSRVLNNRRDVSPAAKKKIMELSNHAIDLEDIIILDELVQDILSQKMS
mgnify:CR=1 FL=1